MRLVILQACSLALHLTYGSHVCVFLSAICVFPFSELVSLHLTYGSHVCVFLSAIYMSPFSVSNSPYMPMCSIYSHNRSIGYVSPLTQCIQFSLSAYVFYLFPQIGQQAMCLLLLQCIQFSLRAHVFFLLPQIPPLGLISPTQK